MKKLIYNSIGGVSLCLGIIGAFLPLLPSTCFILLSTWAFAKSLPTFHDWLYFKSPFSQSIQDWQNYRVIPNKVKWLTTTSIIASYAITLAIVENVYVLSVVGMGLVILLIYLFSKPSNKQHKTKQTTYQQLPELHPRVI